MQALGDDYKRLIEAVGDATILADNNGIIRLWNQAVERLFGFAMAEALGRSLQLDTFTARATHVYKTKRNALSGNACGDHQMERDLLHAIQPITLAYSPHFL